MQDVDKVRDLGDLLGIDNLDVVSTATRSHDTIHTHVGWEVLEVADDWEVEVEHHLLTSVWLQGNVLTLHVLGHLEWDGALRHLVKKVEGLCLGGNICDDDFAFVWGLREEFVWFARVLVRALSKLVVAVNDHNVVLAKVNLARLDLLLKQKQVASGGDLDTTT